MQTDSDSIFLKIVFFLSIIRESSSLNTYLCLHCLLNFFYFKNYIVWICLLSMFFTRFMFLVKILTIQILYLIEFFSISHYFGIGSDSFYFLRLKFSLLDIKILKKKARQTFRPHMGALFSAINSKINSKFL